MKRLNIFAMMLLVAITASAAPVRQSLNHEDWKFKQQRGIGIWYDATVPGVIHTDLMANEIIEDPFYRLNERGVQWIDKEDWVYQTEFVADKEILSKECIELVFEGLDTYADVYLNNEETPILKADNMFRRWRINVKESLKEGNNLLKVYFHSPVKIDMPKWEAMHPVHYPCQNDQSANGGLLDRRISVYARKAGYHYGWDWGPRLVTCGIWRPVYLEAWNNIRIEDVYYNQKSVTAKRADVSVEIDITATSATTAEVRIIDETTGKVLATTPTELKVGKNAVVAPFSIAKPQLWWTYELGKPHRYNFRTEIVADGKVLDSRSHKIGLRSVRLVREDDADGRSFYFELNGQPIFAKGANYIPCDNFLPRVSEATYIRTIEDAVNVNMNMLRVWGGGIYENDIFYELCDSYGIMVWQDFMFACALYPAEGALLESIRQEAIDNVKRLRNHPSIVVWCGNNECNMNLRSAKKKYEQRGTPEVFERMFRQYSDVYYKTLPEVVAELDPMRPYHPCSPFSGKGIPSKEAADPSKGDSHYWGVWHSKLPIDNYNTMRSRFFSEYGFQSFPEFESIKIYAPEERDWAVESEVMSAHQRGGTKANSRIRIYLENEYWPAKDFPSFVYINHVLQGDAIKTAMEAHRRDKPYCWGTIFWQHNDCWPVASWSSRDYYGRWKAQHYFTKYAYDDILVSAYNRDGRLKVYVVSDRLTSPKAELEVVIMDFNGNVVNKFVKSFKIAPNASTVIVDVATEEALGGAKAGDVFIASRLKVGERTYTNNNFFVKQNELNYPAANVTTKITEANDGFDVTLTTDNFARAVFMSIESVNGSVAGIDNFFSDNYFNLMPGSSRTIHVRTSLSAEEFAKQLRVVHLVQTK